MAPAPRREPPAPALQAPDAQRTGSGDVRGADRVRRPRAGLAVADQIHAVTSQAGLDGEAIHNVRLLERFALLEVPAGDAARVAARRRL